MMDYMKRKGGARKTGCKIAENKEKIGVRIHKT